MVAFDGCNTRLPSRRQGVGGRRIVACALKPRKQSAAFAPGDLLRPDRGKRLGKILSIRRRALKAVLGEDAPVRRVLARDAGCNLLLRVREIRCDRARARNHCPPLGSRSVCRIPRRRHALNLPVDPAERLVHIGIKSALLMAAHLVLMEEEFDLGQGDRAVNPPPCREHLGRERRKSLAELPKLRVLVLQIRA
jgi:hypothetical protein